MPSNGGSAARMTRSATTDLASSSLQSAQPTPAKRKRRDEENDTESEHEGGDDRKTRPLTEEQLEAMTELTSHSSRFEVDTSKMEVMALLQWHLTNTSRSSQLVYDKKYQRDQNVGWDLEKKSQYLKTVMAGQAATPFVANVVRSQARLMDGGHRLQALVAFFKDEIPMQIKGSEVWCGQLTEEDKQHFYSRKLQVMEFKNLPFKDEVDFFIQINSGLPLSPGERLHAISSCNPATKLADLVVKEPTAEDDVMTLSRVAGKPSTGSEEGRKNELLIMTFFVFTMIFRKRDDLVKLTTADTFLHDVCKLNEEAEWGDGRKLEGKSLAEHKVRVQGLLKRTLDLYKNVKRPDRQTDFRCLVTCMLAVLEIEEDKLRPELLSTLMARTGNAHLDRIFKNTSRCLKPRDIKEFKEAYKEAYDGLSSCQPAPPPPPSGVPPPPPGGI